MLACLSLPPDWLTRARLEARVSMLDPAALEALRAKAAELKRDLEAANKVSVDWFDEGVDSFYGKVCLVLRIDRRVNCG